MRLINKITILEFANQDFKYQLFDIYLLQYQFENMLNLLRIYLKRLKREGIILLFLMYLSCSQEEADYNPCLVNRRIEDPRPSQHSLEWLPDFSNGQNIYGTNSNEKINFESVFHQEFSESLQSSFKIQCPQDSTQCSKVNYTSFEYINSYNVSSPTGNLAAIKISLDVLVDELNSNLDDIKIFDYLKIDFIIRLSSSTYKTIGVLQFPVLDRGYEQMFPYNYKFLPSIVLNNTIYKNVYCNYENVEQLKVYYNETGLVAFEINGTLYRRN